MKCKHCGFEIQAAVRPSDIEAQDLGYCNEGCRDVVAKLNEWNKRAALEVA